MTSKLLTLTATAAVTLTPVAALSQARVIHHRAREASYRDKDSPKLPKPGKIQTQTNPQKNATSQSESMNGMNKNGQPQQ
jgi:hypothetical protein